MADTVLKTANPAPLGLLGFGMTTVLLNLANVEIFKVDVMIIAMALFVGGLAQFVAGMWSFRQGNTFNATAFSAYGVSWWCIALINTNPDFLNIGTASNIAMAFFWLCWSVFTACMFCGTLKGPNGVKVVFATLAILYLLLALQSFDQGNSTWGFIAGIDGILCGGSAMYAAVGFVLRDTYNKKVLPGV